MIPTSIFAGDNLAFSINDSEHPSPSWVCTAVVRNGANSYPTVMSAIMGGAHGIDASTESWVPGDYTLLVVAASVSSRETIYEFPLTVRVDPMSGKYDDRSEIKKILDDLTALVGKKIDKDAISYSIAGRSIQSMTPEQIIALKQEYQRMYDKELRDLKASRGEQTSSKIKVRFR